MGGYGSTKADCRCSVVDTRDVLRTAASLLCPLNATRLRFDASVRVLVHALPSTLYLVLVHLTELPYAFG